MSILDIFSMGRTASNQKEAVDLQAKQLEQRKPEVPGPGSPEANPTVPNNSNTPERKTQPGENPNEQSPMEKYKNLFQNPSNPTEQADPFDLDPQKFQETAAKMDFTKSISKEDLAKIAAGGEDAVAALASVINKVGQQSFLAAGTFAAKAVQSGMQHTRSSLAQELPDQFRRQTAKEDLFANNPSLRDPAAEPLIVGMQQQFAKQFPNASAKEINDMVTDYLGNQLPNLFKPKQSQDTRKQSDSHDFSSFLQ